MSTGYLDFFEGGPMLQWLTEHIEDAADEGFGFLAGERSERLGGMSAPPSKPSKRKRGSTIAWFVLPWVSTLLGPDGGERCVSFKHTSPARHASVEGRWFALFSSPAKGASGRSRWSECMVLPPGWLGAKVAPVSMNYLEHLERRREVCGGELVVKGTRVTVRTLLASLSEGARQEEILADFPTVSAEALRAVIAFAAASAGEDMPVSPVPAAA